MLSEVKTLLLDVIGFANQLAKEFEDAKKYEEAILIYQKLLEIFPKHEDTIFNCGRLHTLVEKHEEAFKYYIQLYEINSSYPGLSLLIADTYLESNNIVDSIPFYQNVIKQKTNPNEIAEAWYKLGLILKKVRETAQAEKYFKKALEINNKHSKALKTLTEIQTIREQQKMELQTISTSSLFCTADLAKTLPKEVKTEPKTETTEADAANSLSLKMWG